MYDPNLPNTEGLSPFDQEIPLIPEDCADCPIADSVLQKALSTRALAAFFLDATFQRPDNEIIVQDLEDNSEMQEILRSLLTEIMGYQPEEAETTEQIVAIMNQQSGEWTNNLIQEANSATTKFQNLLDNCGGGGQQSVIVPRKNRRPARISYCDGAINSAAFMQGVATAVTVEEID